MRSFFSCILLLFRLLAVSTECNYAELSIQAVTPRLFHLEEPYFDFQKQMLFFCDQYGKKFCIYNLHSENTTCVSQDLLTGAIVPIAGLKNQYAVGMGSYFGILKWNGISLQSKFIILQSVQADGGGNQTFNVGKADCFGRLWIGTGGLNPKNNAVLNNQGNLYYYSRETCNLELRLKKINFTDGIAWDPHYTKMYFIGYDQYTVLKFDYNKMTGEISNQQPFLDFRTRSIGGVPYGLTTDINGNLWIACYLGFQIIKVDPISAEILKTIKLAVSQLTAVTWGGPNFDILYVTTSQKGLSEKEQRRQPLAGTVIAIAGLTDKGFPQHSAIICHKKDQEAPVAVKMPSKN